MRVRDLFCEKRAFCTEELHFLCKFQKSSSALLSSYASLPCIAAAPRTPHILHDAFILLFGRVYYLVVLLSLFMLEKDTSLYSMRIAQNFTVFSIAELLRRRPVHDASNDEEKTCA